MHRLAGQQVDARHRQGKGARPPTPTRASPPRVAMPDDRPRLGKSRGRAHSAHSSSAAAARPRCRWSSRRSTGRRRLRRRDDGLRDDRRRGRRRSARCAAIRWRCCRSAATTWATISATGSRCSGSSARRRAFSTSTGSARTPTASSCGRASARTCAC